MEYFATFQPVKRTGLPIDVAYAGEYRGIEVIEVRGKGSDLALVERMKLLEPEVKIR